MVYTETFFDHYRRPRNLGDLADPDAVAIVHDATCGDVLRVALALAADRPHAEARIGEVRCKAYGCAATIAVASVLSELAAGASVERARRITPAEVVGALGGLPPGRLHAADLGCAALRAAIDRLLPGHGSTGPVSAESRNDP